MNVVQLFTSQFKRNEYRFYIIEKNDAWGLHKIVNPWDGNDFVQPRTFRIIG